jgi:hypothetical protein
MIEMIIEMKDGSGSAQKVTVQIRNSISSAKILMDTNKETKNNPNCKKIDTPWQDRQQAW